MEGESPLLKDGALSLQTSLTHRELSPSAPACAVRRFVSLCMMRVHLGKVFAFGEVGICCSVRLSHSVGGWGALGIMPCTRAEIPPAGAPSGVDSAAIVGFHARHCTVVPLRSE